MGESWLLSVQDYRVGGANKHLPGVLSEGPSPQGYGYEQRMYLLFEPPQ